MCECDCVSVRDPAGYKISNYYFNPSILYNKRNAIIKVTSIKHLFENYFGKV